MIVKRFALFDLFSIKLQRFRLCGGDQGFPVALDLRMRKLGQGNQTHDVGGRPHHRRRNNQYFRTAKERNLYVIAQITLIWFTIKSGITE